MALLRTLLVVMLCMTFFLYLGGYETMFSTMITGGTDCAGSSSFLCTIYNNFNLLLLGMGAVTAAVLLGSFSFPNPYIIFAGLALVFLNFFTFPISLLTTTEFPIEFKAFFVAVFQLLYLLAVLEFFKGGET